MWKLDGSEGLGFGKLADGNPAQDFLCRLQEETLTVFLLKEWRQSEVGWHILVILVLGRLTEVSWLLAQGQPGLHRKCLS